MECRLFQKGAKNWAANYLGHAGKMHEHSAHARKSVVFAQRTRNHSRTTPFLLVQRSVHVCITSLESDGASLCEMLDKVLRTANRKCYYVGIILLL